MEFSNLKVILSSVPQWCKLKLIKAEILKTLDADKYAVAEINKCKTVNGEIIPGKLEVKLTSAQGKKRVLSFQFFICL